ncbi:hypothetical protein HHI36_009241 [Cryptolaemus montrouzieri]|uniref:Uncharacterized protein n=1 Tax=Cryptolaemus montrouzieri TaxID=559131 RepID=A0ABD2MVJ8_9CUCU
MINSKSNHLTFYTKERAEVESESTPEAKFTPKTTKVRFAPEPQIDLIEIPPESQTVQKKLSLSDVVKDSCHGMECLELDLVISFKPEENKKVNLVKPRIAVTEENREQKLQFTTFQKTSASTTNSSDVGEKSVENGKDLDVLTSISQDLDYLLNREEDLANTLKKKRLKSPKKTRQEQLDEEVYPEVMTEISRTHC